jgi:hypothetical protein
VLRKPSLHGYVHLELQLPYGTKINQKVMLIKKKIKNLTDKTRRETVGVIPLCNEKW